MASARGDSKPCTHADCSGTMLFSRDPLPQTSSTLTADGERGWICSENPGHFLLALARPPAGAAAEQQPSMRR